MASVLRLPFSLAAGAANRLINPTGRPSDDALRKAVEGRALLVTGASHGIGRELAKKVASAGATVAMVARSDDVLDELEQEIAELGGEAHGYPADLTDFDGVPALAERMTDEVGVFDVVVANAGHSIRRSVADAYDRFHDFQRTIDINYLAPVRLLLELLPAMRERGSGHIVNTSTIGALAPPAPVWSAYAASKTAFDVWLRSVAAEMRTDGVTATSVYLALVKTRMSAPTFDDSSVPGLDPGEAADVLCRAIVERPQVIAPWWAHAAAGIDGVARGPSDLLMRHVGRRFA
jgi:NAD(P)-dependent dehydrogenase (short-subunit alcohol dehydrogenase family)